MDINTQAEILVGALPYIQRYTDKIVVVKYGGNAMLNEDLKNAVMRDIVLLSLVGVKIVLVHGGGPEINDMLKKVGKESKFINGLRYTDDETVEIVEMVLAGKVNKNLVMNLQKNGGKAVGFCGVDGNIILADEISPDTCRLWDVNTNEKLDKDRFRRDLGDLVEGYEEVLARLNK